MNTENPEFALRIAKIESVLAEYIPQKPDKAWTSLSFGNIDSCITDAHIENLLRPCRNLLGQGGKRWRPLLLVLCAELAAHEKNAPEHAVEKAYRLTPLVECAHTASLIHDDIEDNSDIRRGKPAAHITFGLDAALNSGSWFYFEGASCIENLDIPPEEKNLYYSIFMTELRRLHLGQALDIYWHNNPDSIPSVAEYTAMVRNKTGTLARLAVKLGILTGGGSREEAEAAGRCAEDIGTGFQIIDDVKNLVTGNAGKNRGDDIVEGKKSLPVLYYIEANPKEKETLATLFKTARDEGIESPAVEKAIHILTESGAIERARKTGIELFNKKSAELGAMFKNDGSLPQKLIAELLHSIKNA